MAFGVERAEKDRPLEGTEDLIAVGPTEREPRYVPASRTDRWIALCVVLTYAALVLGGVTTSSIGTSKLRVEPEAVHSDTLGDIQSIRSDEYNVSSPIVLSIIATASKPTLSSLAAPAEVVQRYASGVFQSIAYPDVWVLRAGGLLPDEMAFAAYWWLPSVLVLLMTPMWFRLLGAPSSLGWLAGALIVLAPANWWWSFQPSQQLAFTLAGCVALLSAHRRFVRGELAVPVGQAVLAGVLLAGLPSRYLPWAIMLGGTVLLATAVRVLTTGDRRSLFLTIGVAGAFAMIVGGGALVEGRAGLEALLGTTYPGSRRAGASAQPIEMIFGAPFLGELSQSAPVGTNASEFSTAPNVAFLLLAVVLAALPRVARRSDLPLLSIAGLGLVWLTWGMIDLGDVGTSVPVLSLVLPERSIQVVGILGILAACLALGRLQRPLWHVAIVSAILCGLTTAFAGSLALAGPLPEMRRSLVLGTSVAVALAVLLLVKYPARWLPIAVTVALAVGVIVHASPIQRGLGDLRGSAAASYLAIAGQEARASGTVWASDFGPFDVLMVANGVPPLAGLQRSGPDIERWQRLDPAGEAEASWNRGGGNVRFRWDEGLPTQIADDGFDFVLVAVDPCALAKTFPELARVASVEPLEGSCLRPVTELTWSGRTVHIYEVLG